ncbi:Spermidine N(1)-acetyltransferase [Koleobacter methoxysyntrophicus]|uniref:Spermidine N(1)-acetyltransferase n=1 Tax=Koleobacter methoxysyntrophicus TaxID=2751313 RepID=A0A8A0RST7_9FIRM|nr:UDP-4-amino-4,6-dideoxy-N-acetyl-beta-L-altrosamine N-acetyltransferase [Koleobacter methoxysyntrophicus]QSQ10397.1 Spermidine N(1)-acetyltransferase [Koleobacter methoxysyntrophicus]
MKVKKMLQSERLKLRVLEEQDGSMIVVWRNQKEVIDQLFSYVGITAKQHFNWYEKYINDDTRLEFIIEIKDKKKPIGTIGLNNIDFKNQKAELGIMIGELTEQGKGYGEEAVRSLLQYAFDELNLQKIYLKTFCDNEPAVRLYKKVGFHQEGILRKEIFKNGKFKDVIIMSILKDEWKR